MARFSENVKRAPARPLCPAPARGTPRHSLSILRGHFCPPIRDSRFQRPRAAPTPTSSAPTSECLPLFWHVASSEDEAAYLTVLLNAPSLRRAFFESRESGRHFQLHPWRKVPIPRYDGKNRWHVELAELCRRAEDAAQTTAAEVKEIHPNAGSMKLSNAVRKRLEVDGIFPSVDRVAARLLPDQAGIDSGSAPS